MIGIGIGVGAIRYGLTPSAPPSGFATAQWQLLTTTFWNNITDTWT